MFGVTQLNTWYAGPHGTPREILYTTNEVVHYIRNGRTYIASTGRSQTELEPLIKVQTERIAKEIETVKHLEKLRAQRAA